MLRAPLLVCALALAGCVSPNDIPFLGDPSPMAWTEEVEPSMAPDFRGQGDTYPVLLVHQHHVPSPRQQEEARRNPVVCLAMDGAPLRTLGAADMAACPMAPVDAATGRVYAEPPAAPRPLAYVVSEGSCGGYVAPLDAATRSFRVQARGHEFVVDLEDNGTFRVDGRWIEPGTALKLGYHLRKGSALDEEHVRVVFDAPGGWLWSRMGPRGPTDDDVPGRPARGTGLLVDVPLRPASPVQALGPVLAATPDAQGVLAMRAVHDGDRLTELTVRVATPGGAVAWYGAGRTGDAMRLLGAEQRGTDAPDTVAIDELAASFDATWAQLRAGVPGAMTDVRLASNVSWRAPLGLPLALDARGDPLGCDGGCVLVRGPEAWSRLLLAERAEAEGARTLHILAFGEADPSEVWWHDSRPAG